MSGHSASSYAASAQRTIRMESQAVAALEQRIGEDFARACECLLGITGRVIVTGMGKSGHIACKIAATLASTGTPAFFVHPGEASHGDMGMITASDAVIALSNSGAVPDVITLLPLLKRLGVPLISMTGNDQSMLAKASEVHLLRVRDFVAQKKLQGREVREIHCDTTGERLVAGLPVRVGPEVQAGIVLKEDTFVELGNPSVASSSFVVWNSLNRSPRRSAGIPGPSSSTSM